MIGGPTVDIGNKVCVNVFTSGFINDRLNAADFSLCKSNVK